MNIEDFINAGMLWQQGQRPIVFDRLEPELHASLFYFPLKTFQWKSMDSLV